MGRGGEWRREEEKKWEEIKTLITDPCDGSALGVCYCWVSNLRASSS